MSRETPEKVREFTNYAQYVIWTSTVTPKWWDSSVSPKLDAAAKARKDD